MSIEQARLIGEAAAAVLEPNGFRRTGRSQTWFADRGFWLSIAQFQPALNVAGCFLHVAVHWLWGLPPHVLSFDRVRRVGGSGPYRFSPFENEAQFRPLACALAATALTSTSEDQSRFQTIERTACDLLDGAASRESGTGWPAFHASAAAALAGRGLEAVRLLESVGQLPARRAAGLLLESSRDPEALGQRVRSLVDREREHFDLPPLHP